MNRATRFLPVLLTALTLAAPTRSDSEWLTFESWAGRFRVDMPSQPGEEHKKKWFPISSFESTVYRSSVDDDIFGVNHTDIPGFAMVFASHDKIFQSTREGFLDDSQASEVAYHEIQLLGRDARQLTYDIPPLESRPAQRGTAKMFFEGNRLYMFYTEVTETVAEGAVERFFSSIQMLDDD